MKKTMLKVAVAAAFAFPFAGGATIYQFQTSLSGANEVPSPIVTSATGFSILFYDDFGTAGVLTDDLLSVTTWANNLNAALRNPDTGGAAHIHFPATTTQTAGAIVNLTTPAAPLTASYSTGGVPGSVSFFSVVSGPAPTGTNTANSETDTLLSALLAGRAYANIHTTAHTSGEIRGQYALVPTIPEPETYALMLAGLGIVGWVVSRRHKVGV